MAQRLFIAIELPANVVEALAEVQEALRRQPGSQYVRWVDPASVHLTLRFLGDTREDLIPEIEGGLSAACRDTSPFELRLAGLGAFPNQRRPRVLWVGTEPVEDSGGLAELQRQIERTAVRLGFEPESRGFSPHLTLGRVKRGVGSAAEKAVGELLSCGVVVPEASFEVTQVCLMRSALRPEGAVYTRVAASPLCAPEP